METHQTQNTTGSPNTPCRECGQSAKVDKRWGRCHECRTLRHAMDAFWSVVAAAHPEITTGDGDYSDLEEQCRNSIREWVSNNSVTCDECDRNCTADGVGYDRVDTGDRWKAILCEACVANTRFSRASQPSEHEPEA